MRAMDTDRFVNDLNRKREKDRKLVSSATPEAERNRLRGLLGDAVCWVRNYDTYIERQKLRTYSPQAASEKCPSLKTVDHKVTFNSLDRDAYPFQNIGSHPSLSKKPNPSLRKFRVYRP